jgi:hypothetical protein
MSILMIASFLDLTRRYLHSGKQSIPPSAWANCRAPIAFMHIPKTSGTALVHGLAQALSPCNPLMWAYDRVLFGTFDAFETLDQSLRALVHTDTTELPTDVDFVAGHVACSTLRRNYAGFRHLTVLREPRSRLLSHWLYFRSAPAASLPPWGKFADRIKLSHGPFRNYLSDRRLACQTDNLYARMLLWPHPLIPDNDFISSVHDQQLLSQAADRLRDFDHADVMENPTFRTDLSEWVGCDITYPVMNQCRPIQDWNRPDLAGELSVAALGVLQDRTRLDSMLWRIAASRRLSRGQIDLIAEQAFVQSLIRQVTVSAASA